MASISFEYTYEALVRELEKLGFDWVVNQVQEQIRSGKLVEKVVAPFSGRRVGREEVYEIEFEPYERQRSRTKLVATDAYSPSERLELVVAAIEFVVVHMARLEQELQKLLADDHDLNGIRFEPDDLDDSMGFEVEVDQERLRFVETLRSALEDVKRELNYAD